MNKNTRLAQYEKAETGDVMGTLGLKDKIQLSSTVEFLLVLALSK